MSGKYEVLYFDYNKKIYFSAGYYNYFFKAKKVSKKLLKEWYCVHIVIRR